MYSNRDMLTEERDSLRRQLQQYRKTLLRLEEQKANYGLNVPIDILNGIENAQENIERIETRLQQVTAELEYLPPEPATPEEPIQPKVPQKRPDVTKPAPQPTPPIASEPHREFQPAKNPYANRAVIKDPVAFVGRTAELQDLYSLLAAVQSCSVVGPRRIGKSSLLYYLTQPAVYGAHLSDPDSYIFGFMDLQELASLEPDDFFFTAVEQLSRASQGGLDVDLDRDGTRSGFRRFLMRVSDAGLRLVLCCDEFEMLSRNANFGVDFFTYLRGLCSNYNLALVTSSRTSLFDLCHQGDLQTSQFWNIFVERTLGLMPEHEATVLINEPFTGAGGTLTHEDVAFVLNLAGRYPFFIQIVCYHLFAAQSASAPTDLAAIEQRFFDEARHHYAYAWEQLDEEEQATLVALTQTEGQAIASPLFQQLVRNVLVTGTPDSPTLVSKGWRRFIESKVQAASTSQPRIVTPLESITVPSPPTPEAEIDYADFEFKVEQIDPTSCRVLVLDSPAGQDSVICKLPFSLDTIGGVMVDLGQQIARGAAEQTLGHTTPTAIGEALFQSVFSGSVSHLFFESMGRVHSQGQGLRIKIHVDPEKSPQLAALPWEFLYNDRRRNFLGLSRSTPIVRYLDVQAPTDRPRISLPLQVLVVIASPVGLPPLDLSREQEFIQQAWGSRPEVSVEFLDTATPSALQAKLWDWQPHVLHFMGHGHFDAITGAGALLLTNHKNEPKPIVGAQLGVLLSNAPSVRLAFLNACQSAELSRSSDLDPFSGVAAALVMAGLPAVVAMQFPISDQAALAFANGFYPRLATGEPVELAVSFGREAIQLEVSDNQEWGTPVLFMRVSDGRLFEIGGSK
ncbi:CHAT domain-containing protein [Chloroflexota bacterium]